MGVVGGVARHMMQGASLVAVIVFTTAPALAQDAVADAPSEEVYDDDVIIVTAQKRAQNVQNVGMAITAIDGDTLLERGVQSGQDLAKIIPNVSLQNIGGGGLPVVIMRGIGLQNFRVNDSPTTSFYIDEIYQASIVSAEFSMFDLDRVEVLKGPQGGLYGRNTIGGAIQVISRKPELGGEVSGYVTAGFGSYAERTAEGGITLPLGNAAAVRVSGRYQKSDDLYTRSIPGNFKQGGIDRLAGRVMLRAEPASNIEINIKAHAGRDQSATPLLRTVGLYRDNGTAAGIGAPNVSLALLQRLLNGPPALCSSILAGAGSDPYSCATLTGQTPVDYGLLPGDGNRYHSAIDGAIPRLDTDWWGASMVTNIEFVDFTLTPIVAYDKIDYARVINADATPVEFQVIDYTTGLESWQGEMRLAYDAGGAFTAIGGINYAEDKLDEDTMLLGADGVLPLFFGGAVASPQSYNQKIKTFAVYGHAELELTNALRATGELRYTDSKTAFSGGQQFQFANGTLAPFYSVDDSTSFSKFSGKFALDYEVADDVLLFASVSRGFKTGGFFGGFATNANQLVPFKAETIWAYEAGFKSRFWDRRMILNGSFFYYDRDNVQQNASDPTAVPSIARLTNIGSVRAYGAELDLSFRASDNFDLTAGLGLTDSKVNKSTYTISSVLPTLGSASLEGTNTPNYSKFSLNVGGRFHHPVSDNVEFRTNVDFSYRSSVDLSTITNEVIEAPIFRQPGYALVNLRMGFADINDRWDFAVFANNLLDTSYRVEARGDGLYGVRELYGAPRTIGANVTYRFGN